jgi:hypothetical protein
MLGAQPLDRERTAERGQERMDFFTVDDDGQGETLGSNS